MNIETNISKQDLFSSGFIYRVKNYIFWLILMTIGVGVNGHLIIKSFKEHSISNSLIFIFALILGIILFGIAVCAVESVVGLLRSLRSKGVLGKHEYTISDNGLEERTNVNHDTCTWENVIKISESKSYIFIKLYEGRVHVIPKRSFLNKTQYEEFKEISLRNNG